MLAMLRKVLIVCAAQPHLVLTRIAWRLDDSRFKLRPMV